MGGYAIFTFEKLKNPAEMSSRYKHNFRIYEDIANVDYRRTEENIEFIFFFFFFFLMKINGVEQRIRKDVVLGYEIFMGYSHDSGNIPIKEWAEKCLSWLEKTFNPEDREIMVKDK